MIFNPAMIKQGLKIIYSKNTTKTIHLELIFNNIPVSKAAYQKDLWLHLNSKCIHMKPSLTKGNRTIDFL